MDLDRTLTATFRNYSTLFLVVFVLLLPLHLVYGWVFQDVLAVRELHPAIADFPSSRQVRGVGQADVQQARLWSWILVALEVALLPVIVRACRRVLDQDEAGEITTVAEALRAIRRPRTEAGARPAPKTVVAAGVIALVIAFLAEATLTMAAGFTPDAFAFAALALASAAGRSCGIPFLAVALASRQSAPAQEVPELY